MDQQLQEALALILTQSSNAVVAGVSFLKAELPEVIKQLLLWNMVHSLIKFGLFFVIAVVSYRMMKSQHDLIKQHSGPVVTITPEGRHRESEHSRSARVSAMWFKLLITSALTVLFSILAMLEYTWIKIIVAPKVWLIEYAATLTQTLAK